MKATRFFLVKCPKCKNKMKYSTTDITLRGKYKRCVYCGKNIVVRDSVVKG